MKNYLMMLLVIFSCSGCLYNTHKDPSSDLNSLFSNMGQPEVDQPFVDIPVHEPYNPETNTNTVPEPLSLLLLAGGLPFVLKRKKV